MSATITAKTWQLLQERLEELLAEAKVGRIGLFWIACPGTDCWHCPTRRCEAQLDLALFDDDGLCRCPHGHDVQITKDQMRVDRLWAPTFPTHAETTPSVDPLLTTHRGKVINARDNIPQENHR